MKNKVYSNLLLVIGLISILAISCQKDEEIPKGKINFNSTLTYGMVKDFDNNIYKTITIGRQVWMAENLRTTHYRNGSPIPNQTNIEIDDAVIPSKKGWEYVAIRYGKKLSEPYKTRLVVTILQIDVHQVYKEKDFSELGIGIETWEELTQSNVQDSEFILFPFGN